MFRYLALFALILLAYSVPQLSDEDFDSFIKDNDHVFVKFYAPWCGHCQRMAPDYEELYEQTKDKSYKVVKVNCITSREACQKGGVEGFPTLKFYIRGHAVQYNGPRSSSSIANWIHNQLEWVVHPLEAEQVHQKIGKEAFVLASGLDPETFKVVDIANILTGSNLHFYALKSNTPFIRLYRADGSELEHSTSNVDAKKLADWAFHNSRPVLLPLDNDFNAEYVTNQQDYKHILVFIDHEDERAKQIEPILTDACHQHSKAILCIRVSRKSEQYAEYIGLTRASEDKSSFTVLTQDKIVGYTYSQEEISRQKVEEFVTGALSDSIYRTIDEERQLREAFDYKHAIKLTDDTFAKTIKQNRYVFVEFYSPRCGHCVKFAPDFDKIAAYFKNNHEGKVVVAAVDVTQNPKVSDSEGIEGFPTLYLYVAGQILQWNEHRDADRIAKWIEEISYARLMVAPKKTDPVKPYIAISGIDENHFMNSLPALYNRHPVYLITGDKDLSIEIQGKQVTKYEGKIEIQAVAQWLQEKTAPVLVSLGETQPAKKLLHAMKKSIPLLAIVNKHERSAVSSQLDVLEKYCKDNNEYLCAYVHADEPDYADIIKFLNDEEDKETNRLVWINTRSFTHERYEGDFDNLTLEDIAEFVKKTEQPQQGQEEVEDQQQHEDEQFEDL